MKKLILSIIVLASFGFYVVWQNAGDSTNSFIAPTTTSKNTKSVAKHTLAIPTTPIAENSQPTPVTPTPTTVPVVVPPPKKTGLYNDGEYTGNSADAYYGYIKVKAVIKNGKLSDVIFLDYPQDRETSIKINTRAMPILKSEAIQIQSSKVNTVSGATDSSSAFRESLSSALAQAKI